MGGTSSGPCHDAARRRARLDHGDRPVFCGFGAGLVSETCSSSTARKFWAAGQVWQIVTYAFVHAPSGSGCSGSRSRCTCSSFSDAKWNVSSAAAPSSSFTLCSLASRPFFSPWGPLEPVRHGRLRRAPFRNLHRVRHHLSQRRNVPADSGEMGRAGSRGHRHLAALANHDWASMTVFWISIATALFVHPASRNRPRACLVGQFEIPLAAEAEVPGCPEISATPCRRAGK